MNILKKRKYYLKKLDIKLDKILNKNILYLFNILSTIINYY
jgi:hypothetical protein